MAGKTYQTVSEALAAGFVLLEQSNERMLDFHRGQQFIMVYSPGSYGSIAILTLADVVAITKKYVRLALKTPSISIICVFPPSMLSTAKKETLSGKVEINLILHSQLKICFSQIYFRPEAGESVDNPPVAPVEENQKVKL